MNVKSNSTTIESKKIIRVEIKTNYGNEAIYPLCPQGKTFAQLCGTKTLSRQSINLIKKLGYEVEVQQPTLSL